MIRTGRPGGAPGGRLREAAGRLITPCLFIISVIPGCFCAELNVPGDYLTIQAAVDAAIPGDTVLVADGTWSGVGNVSIHPDGKAVKIRSASGDPDACIIDGSEVNQGFICESDETRQTVITGFTLYRCGRDPDLGPVTGAGISCVNASPTIRQCRFVDGDASWSYPGPGSGPEGSGGAIACLDGAAPDIAECDFKNCMAGESGGAIHARAAAPLIRECTFTGNRSFGKGGAIFLGESSASISGCTFDDNHAPDGDGGAICLSSDASEITRCGFSENHSLRGGAIACLDAASVISGLNHFHRNVASAGSDLFAQANTTIIDARFNSFTGLMMSDYYVAPQDAFDLTGGQTTATPIHSDVYVANDGSDGNDGLTSDSPFRTIQFALGRILPTADDPITIHIASGVYSTSTTGEIFPLPLLSHLTLAGADQFRTHLSPDFQSTCEYGFRDTAVRIERIDIMGGSGGEGGGVHASECQLELNDMTIRESVADRGAAMYLSGTDADLRAVRVTDNYSRYMGGSAGVYALGGRLMIVDSFIARNASDGPGGGVYVQSEAHIADCRIIENESRRGRGGGVCSQNGSLELVNCELTRNWAMSGGGVSVTGHCDLLNCLITENVAVLAGAGFQTFDATGIIRHSTIAANTSSGSPVSAVSFEQSTSTVTDSIIWNATDTEIQSADSQTTVTCCDVRGGVEGAGNIDGDPLFKAMPLSEYYLDSGDTGGPVSPCIDSGGTMASECQYSGEWGAIHMDEWTAGADWLRDSGIVDMGVHWDHSVFSGVRLDLTSDMLSPGHRLRLDAVALNHSGIDWNDSRLFVILDIEANYWFAPSWVSQAYGLDCYELDIAAGGRTVVNVIPETIWPDVGSADNLSFWGGLTDRSMTILRGSLDRIVLGYRE